MWNRKATQKTIWTGVMLFVCITLVLPAAIHDPNNQATQANPSQQQTQMGMHRQTATQAGILCRANDLVGSDVKGTLSEGVRSIEQRQNPNEQRRSDQAFDLNQENESIGTVEELVIDNNNDEIFYVVLKSDNKYYPVPWRAFNVQKTDFSTIDQRIAGEERTRRMNENQSAADQRQSRTNQDITTRSGLTSGQKPILYLNITKEQLLQAPTITSVSAADWSNLQLNQTVNTFYSQHITLPMSSRQSQQQIQQGTSQREMQTARQERTTGQGERQAETGRLQSADSQLTAANLLKASEVIGLDVQSSTDVNLGSIKDLVIDTREGQIAYGLVSFGGFLTMGQKIAVVPWTALTVQMPQRLARIQATQDQLDAVVLDKGSIEKLSDPKYAQNIHSSFNVEPYWGIYGYVPADGEKSESTEQNRQQDQQQRNINQQQQPSNRNQDQQQRNTNQDQRQSQP